jgi:hypothetical protein
MLASYVGPRRGFQPFPAFPPGASLDGAPDDIHGHGCRAEQLAAPLTTRDCPITNRPSRSLLPESFLCVSEPVKRPLWRSRATALNGENGRNAD